MIGITLSHAFNNGEGENLSVTTFAQLTLKSVTEWRS